MKENQKNTKKRLQIKTYLKDNGTYLLSTQNKGEEFIRLNLHNGNYFYDFYQYINKRFSKIEEEGEFCR